MGLLGTLFTPSLKNKKIHPKKNPFYFMKWNFLALILKKFLYFRKRKPREKIRPRKLLILRETKTLKKLLIISQKKAFLIYRKTETPKKIVYISGNGSFSYFSNKLSELERNFSAPSFKKLLYFRRELAKPEYQNFLISG